MSTVPVNWIGGRVPAKYDALYLNYATAPRGARPGEILDDEHDLVQRAVRWVRESRYSRQDDHRMAVRLTAGIDQPDLIATFLATVRAADHTEMEQLLAVRVGADGTVDPEDALGLLHEDGLRKNIAQATIAGIFSPWWQAAIQKAEETARQRAERWRESARQKRFAEQGELKRQFDLWAKVTRETIAAGYDTAQYLPGMEKPLPPAAQRRLREHRKQVDQYDEFLNQRLVFETPTVEPLGVLLRVPAKEVK